MCWRWMLRKSRCFSGLKEIRFCIHAVKLGTNMVLVRVWRFGARVREMWWRGPTNMFDSTSTMLPCRKNAFESSN